MRSLFTSLLFLVVFWASSQPVAPAAEPPADALLELHTAEARSYQIALDEDGMKELALSETPVFTWTNLSRENTQTGHVFLWTENDRPAVIGTIFSVKTIGTAERFIVHEFHSLNPGPLFPKTPATSAFQWRPKGGIELTPVPAAPIPAASPPQRLLQMRSIARDFAAETLTQPPRETYQLRLLTTPLIRYQPASGDVQDGALFAMVTSAGTDPELLLLIESRHPAANSQTWTWHAAALRFSDRDMVVHQQGKPLWSSLDDESHRVSINAGYTLLTTPDGLYTCYRARTIPELPVADE